MSILDTTAMVERIAGRIDKIVTGSMEILSNATGGLTLANMDQVMEFAKTMAVADIGIRKHLRGNVGACLNVALLAIEWQMSPFAVANKSYLVNDQLAFEAQLITAVILRRAPIKGRLKYEFSGEGDDRVCRVSARLRDDDEVVDYTSPRFGKITPKNSPLWKNDPDQQLCYFSSRALCRRHFPDVLLGVYAVDELDEPAPRGPTLARDVTPRNLAARLDALAAPAAIGDKAPPPHDPETGEVEENSGQEPEKESLAIGPKDGSASSAATAPKAAPVLPKDAGASSNLPPAKAPASGQQQVADDAFPGDRPSKPSPVAIALQLGRDARRAGKARSTMPKEYTSDERVAEADAFADGFAE